MHTQTRINLDQAWTIPSSPQELRQAVEAVIGETRHAPDPGQERAAIYIRVSVVDPRAKSYSMDLQPDRAEEYARSQGWIIVGIYADPDRTGRNSRRRELQRMIRDIIAGRVTVIVVHRLDRLYRNLESLLKFIRLIKRYNVHLVSVTENIDTDTPWGRLVIYVLGGIAEMYVWSTSERTREAKVTRVEQGLSNASARFGYCNGLCSTCTDPNGPSYCPLVGSPDRGRGRVPVPHPIESHAARLIAVLYSQGMSDSDITDYLNTHDFTLPDGPVVHFRTKGRPGLFPPGPFKRDSVRDIVRNPFYAGLVARYPSKPLDMEDDPEHPDRRRPNPDPIRNKRQAEALTEGQHEALYSVQLWQHNQHLRQNKGTTPNSQHRPRREYMLTGVGRCWVCAQYDGREANLRGVTGGPKGREYYRCASVHENYKQRGKKPAEAFEDVLPAVGLSAQANGDSLLGLHTQASLRADKLGAQVDALIGQLVIPEAWYDQILAYYLTDEGLTSFERESYNLRQELARHQALYERGHLTLAQFEQRTGGIIRQLQQLRPAARPEAAGIVSLLKDFPAIWAQMSAGGQRGLLKVMFAGLYFDTASKLRRALAHEPFGELLGLAGNGVMP
ncbi:MAG: recombinase family protein [Thermoflexales bacterium]|nr:recombinase family protein [Thermoflexales bacterium]